MPTNTENSKSKDFYETIQIGLMAFAAMIVLVSIPTCTKRVDINKATQIAAVKISAIENGLVQKVIKREGSTNTDIIWTLPEEKKND